MPQTRRDPLPSDPLATEDQALRSMVRDRLPNIPISAPPLSGRALNRTAVYLTDEESEALRVRAFETRMTKTDILRRALRQYLELD